jgi:hypothetical protein
VTTPVTNPLVFILGKPHPSSLKFMFPDIAAILRKWGYR